MSRMTLIGKNGTAKKYRITGAAAHAETAPYTGFSSSVDGDDLIVTTGKRELGAVQQWVDSLTANPATTATTAGKSERYIELWSVAQTQNLSHGKSWRASPVDVDRHSLNPSWEGESICYVYSK